MAYSMTEALKWFYSTQSLSRVDLFHGFMSSGSLKVVFSKPAPNNKGPCSENKESGAINISSQYFKREEERVELWKVPKLREV